MCQKFVGYVTCALVYRGLMSSSLIGHVRKLVDKKYVEKKLFIDFFL